jgi:hypothetical protein
MLSDALVERYSRQILLADVGGRGQERLCATDVAVHGDGIAAAFAAELLEAAGLRVVRRDGSVATLHVTVGSLGIVRARLGAGGGRILTLVGRPCARCAPDEPWTGAVDAGGATAGAAAQAVGAAVAAEAIRVALGLAAAGREQTIDVGGGTFAARALLPTAGCAACADIG